MSILSDIATDECKMEMTPMIDVVFLLLIFFVCASIGQIPESLLPTPLNSGSIDSIRVWNGALLPEQLEHAATSVEAHGKLAVRWGTLKTAR